MKMATRPPQTQTPQSKENKIPNENLARIRDNQRRSRARRKEYLSELEDKFRKCVQTGVEASAEIQAAARRVLEENRRVWEENRRLKETLQRFGIHEDVGSGSGRELEGMLGMKWACGPGGKCGSGGGVSGGETSPVVSNASRTSSVAQTGAGGFLMPKQAELQVRREESSGSSNPATTGFPTPNSEAMHPQRRSFEQPSLSEDDYAMYDQHAHHWQTPGSGYQRQQPYFPPEEDFDPPFNSSFYQQHRQQSEPWVPFSNGQDYATHGQQQQQQQVSQPQPQQDTCGTSPSCGPSQQCQQQQQQALDYDATSCQAVAGVIRSFRPEVGKELEDALGCGEGAECSVSNSQAFEMIDRFG